MKFRPKKPYIAMVFLAFFVLFSVNSLAYSGAAVVDGKSYDVEKIIINSTLKSRTVSTAFYQIKMPEMTVKTPVATTCYWNKANEDRRCVQTVEIDNAGADLTLKEAFGSSTAFKNLIIKAPDVLKKGSYNITYEFDYPANKGEEWNLTFATPTVSFLIDPTISACSILNATGETYTLTADISSNGTDIGNLGCLEFTKDSITLDCQGHFILGLGIPSAYSIFGDGTDNSMVKNCQIATGWGYGTEFDNSDNVTFKNDTVEGTSGVYALALYKDTNSLIENCTIENVTGGVAGIEFLGTNSSTISNNTFTMEDGFAVYFIDAVSDGIAPFGNLIYGNFINASTAPYAFEDISGAGIWVNGSADFNNSVEGNYWTNATASAYSDTCTDADANGICDDAYDVGANVACAKVADGLPACGNATDWLPLSDWPYVPEGPCVPSWNCTAWGECVRGYQTRECTDNNSCQNETGKPAEIQPCLKGLPNATFNISATCCPISSLYCTNNETLIQLWNTSEGIAWASEDCPYGCDNATSACAPAPYAQNLINILLVVTVILIIGLVYRYAKR